MSFFNSSSICFLFASSLSKIAFLFTVVESKVVNLKSLKLLFWLFLTKSFGNIFFKNWNWDKDIRFFDCVFSIYTFIKFIMSGTLKMFVFTFNFSYFITHITIVIHLFAQVFLKDSTFHLFIWFSPSTSFFIGLKKTYINSKTRTFNFNYLH